MRPVNLIAAEERVADASSNRTGSLVYVVIGALALVLAGVTAFAVFSKQVGDREAELAALQAEDAELQARATNLASFVQFEQTKAARKETIISLARSRFDWERVMRELSAVLPNTVWLTSLSGAVSAEAAAGAGGAAGAAEITGPALTMEGCARSQKDVARLVAALEDIDGVTRVLATRGEKPVAGAAAGTGGEDCRTRSYISKFEAVAAFDEVIAGPPAGGGAPPPETPPATGGNELDAQPAGGEEPAADGQTTAPAATDPSQGGNGNGSGGASTAAVTSGGSDAG